MARLTCALVPTRLWLRCRPMHSRPTRSGGGAAAEMAQGLHSSTAAPVKDQDRLQLNVEGRLGIPREIYEAAGGVRVRQHVNPLKKVGRRGRLDAWPVSLPGVLPNQVSCQGRASWCQPGVQGAKERSIQHELPEHGCQACRPASPRSSTQELQVPTDPPAWGEAYAQPQQPLVLDIGCGYGRFLLALRCGQRGRGRRLGWHARFLGCFLQVDAVPLVTPRSSLLPTSTPPRPRSREMPGHNMLGLEIRAPIIERANKWAASLGLQSSVLFLRWARLPAAAAAAWRRLPLLARDTALCVPCRRCLALPTANQPRRSCACACCSLPLPPPQQGQRHHHTGPHAGRLPRPPGAGVRPVPGPALQGAAQVSGRGRPGTALQPGPPPALMTQRSVPLPSRTQSACQPPGFLSSPRPHPCSPALARPRKRRTVQRQLVEALGRLMPPGGRVFLQSDVLEVGDPRFLAAVLSYCPSAACCCIGSASMQALPLRRAAPC